MSRTDSDSEFGREEEEEEEEEEEAERSSGGKAGEEEEEEEENEEEDDEEGEGKGAENGHTSKGRAPPARSSSRKRNSSSAAAVVANGNVTKAPALMTLAFPIARVRRLVKSEADVQSVGMEAIFLVGKATELFLEKFVEDAFDKMTEDERTVLSYKHLASHVSATDRYDFLADFVPETVPASTALSAKGQQADK